MDEAVSLELGEPLDVDRAPDASLATRSYTLRGAVVVERVADAVDPSKAKLLVDDLLPGDRRAACASAVIAQPQLAGGRMVLFEPRPQLSGRLEEDDVLRSRQGFSEIRKLRHP